MAEIPNYEPSVFTAGETVTWKKSLSDFPAGDGWTLKYFLRGPGAKLDVTCDVDGDDHVATIAAADSAKLSPGPYWLQGRAEKGDEKHVIADRELTIRRGLDSVKDSYDGRSNAQKILDEIDELIATTAPAAIAEYTIGNRHQRFWTVPELIQLRGEYAQIVARERRAERLKAGAPFFENIRMRFMPKS